MTAPPYTRYTLRLAATGTRAAGDAGAAGGPPSGGEHGPGGPIRVDDWSGAPAPSGPDPAALDYRHPEAVALLRGLRVGWQEQEGGDTLVFWLPDGAGRKHDAAQALARLAVLGRLDAADEPPGWEDAWKAFHQPQTIGDLYVRPPWSPPRAGLADVVVEAGMAFGTGGHATTRQCLEELQLTPPGSLLDAGCGSGVVSLAALRLGFAPVWGIDIDPVAIEAAVDNAARNGLAPVFMTGDATDADLPLPAAETVVANIALAPILRLARRFAGEPGGGVASAPAAPCAPGRTAGRAARRDTGRLPGLPAGFGPGRRRVAAAASGGGVTRVASAFVGCKVSQADADQALAELRARGADVTARREDADVVVVHTCCVTVEAEKKSRRLVRRLARDGRRVVVAGCAATLHPGQFDAAGVDVLGDRGWGEVLGLGPPEGDARRGADRRARGAGPGRPRRRQDPPRPQGPGRLRRRVQLLRRASGARAAAQHAARRRARRGARRPRGRLRRGGPERHRSGRLAGRRPAPAGPRERPGRAARHGAAAAVLAGAAPPRRRPARRRSLIRSWRATCTCRCSRPTTACWRPCAGRTRSQTTSAASPASASASAT